MLVLDYVHAAISHLPHVSYRRQRESGKNSRPERFEGFIRKNIASRVDDDPSSQYYAIREEAYIYIYIRCCY